MGLELEPAVGIRELYKLGGSCKSRTAREVTLLFWSRGGAISARARIGLAVLRGGNDNAGDASREWAQGLQNLSVNRGPRRSGGGVLDLKGFDREHGPT